MQTDKKEIKVEKSVSMHLHAFEQPCKRQIVPDTKSRNASHLNNTTQNKTVINSLAYTLLIYTQVHIKYRR